MQKESLDIQLKPHLRLLICPHTASAKLYEEKDAQDYGESRWQLQEGREYEYEFVDDAGNRANVEFLDLPSIVFPRRNHSNEGIICTGLYVGTLTLQAREVGAVMGCDFSIPLEIRSIKASYREDYRQMLSDITAEYAELVMQHGSPVTQTFEVDNEADSRTLYQKFAFVKSIIDSDAFDEAVHKIILNPVRKWEETTVTRRIENVRRLNKSALRQVVSSNQRVRSSAVAGLESLPRTISVPYKHDTTDTCENQFVKYVLTNFYGFCVEVANKQNASGQLKNESRIVCNKLLRYLASGFFKDISLPNHLNLNSPVLQRKEGYREILQGWLFFDLAAKLSWNGGDNVYDAGKRNVAALYEYWLFFKLLKVVSQVFNIKLEQTEKLIEKDKDGLSLQLKQGRMQMVKGVDESDGRRINVQFYYNRTFVHRDNIHEAGSWTLPMRPDYTLSMWPGDISDVEAEKQELIVHVHFDAKYRLDKILLGEETSDETLLDKELTLEKEQEEIGQYEIGIYKRADLLKMHAYKDAIRRTSGAYVLYPGDKSNHKKGYHEIIPGLGAFCISPGNEKNDISQLMNFLREIKKHLLDRASQREKMAFHSYETYKEMPNPMMRVYENLPEYRQMIPDETSVLVGYCHGHEHYKWIVNNNKYNCRAGRRHGAVSVSLASASYLLLHDDKGECHFYKMKKDGPKVYSYHDLGHLHYPFSRSAKAEDIYLVFELDINGTESEFSQYSWEIQNLPCCHGKARFHAHAVSLTELMQYAKRK